MALTRQQMDDQVNQHFMYEATDEIDGVVGSFTENEEIHHEAVPSPVGPLKSLAQVRAYYEMLFPSVRGESVTPIMRLYGDDFLVDEAMWTGEIIDGYWCLCDDMSGHASARLLHVFEFRRRREDQGRTGLGRPRASASVQKCPLSVKIAWR
jgi:hypothetical protein